MQYLYHSDKLATLLQNNGTTSILRSHDHALSVVHTQLGHKRIELLAHDVKGSALSGSPTRGTMPIAFSPWGYYQEAGGMLAGFKGEYCEPVTQCYLLGNGYRSYSPVLMRFSAPDSVSPFGAGGINCYTYLLGDPVNASDPSGHIRGKVLLRENNLGVFTSKKRFWQKKVLNIYAHGEESQVAGMDASALHKHLNAQKIDFDDFKRIHIIACHSGEPGTAGQLSFAQELSNLSQKKVSAYIGTVSTIPKPPKDSRFTKIKILRKNIYKAQDFNYNPVTVQPMAELGARIRTEGNNWSL